MLTLEGNAAAVEKAAKVISELSRILETRPSLTDAEIDGVIDAVTRDHQLETESSVGIEVFQKGRSIVPRTRGQERYIEAIRESDLVFGIGPGGTGKTYLAVAMALSDLKTGRFRKIVLARPAVEAGEKLGFLPGDMQEKVNPYLRPLYDALEDMMAFGQMQKYMSQDIIEVVPLAYMRGRTLNSSFIILDEAQNCTSSQMKMFLTRLGVSSKAVVTGDITQVDLPSGDVSGLVEVQTLLRGIEGIGFVYLTRRDIVRHRLVQEIVDAYESREAQIDSEKPCPEEAPLES